MTKMGGRNFRKPNESEYESDSEDQDSFEKGDTSNQKRNLYPKLPVPSSPQVKSELPSENSQKKKQQPKTKKTNSQFYAIVVVVLSALVGLVLLRHQHSLENGNDNLGKTKSLDEIFQNIQSGFPSQDKRSFQMMKTAVKALLKPKEPKSPSIINLLSFHEADKASKCLAQSLASNINFLLESSSSIHLDAFQYKHDDPGVIKHKIEDAVHSGISNGSKVILVEHFDYIPAESILIFHGLCDDTTAPFKRVVFIFTLQLNDALREKSLKEIEITNPWNTSLESEQRAALESRIGIGKILVNREPNMEDNCIKI